VKNNSIIVKIKNVYGTQRIYPICDKAKLFAALTGTKTLSKDNINNIKALGYQIDLEAQEI
jgi:hypothetical protein